MKSNEMTGFRQVFSFTLSQLFKQSSFLTSMIILCLFSIAIFPVMAMKNGKGEDGGVNPADSVQKIYLCNSSYLQELPLEEAALPVLHGATIVPVEKSALEDLEKQLQENVEEGDADAAAILVDVQRSLETGYTVKVQYAADGSVNESDANNVAAAIAEWLSVYKVESVDGSKDAMEDILAPISVDVYRYNDYVKENDQPISEQKFFVIYALLMILFMVINISSSLVGTKIAEEKTSKIVEYLLTNIRPMALVLGKVLATLVAALIEMGLIVGLGFISAKVSAGIWGEIELLNTAAIGEALVGLNPLSVCVCVFVLLTGLLFFGLLAGLFGAAASKVEEISQGYQVYTMITMVAFFASVISVTMLTTAGSNLFVKITAVFPLTSFLVLPGLLISGEVTTILVVIALLLEVVATILLFWFVARVYESVIVASGKVLKLSDMIRMAKNAGGKGAKA